MPFWKESLGRFSGGGGLSVGGGSACRAFAEWQVKTHLPVSGFKSMGWTRVKSVLRV